MIVTAGNRAAIVVTRGGKIEAVVLLPVHELERRSPTAPEGASLESVTPVFCDTAEELHELLASFGAPPTTPVR